ncbi:dethiobiotin synthase [Aliidiomarina sp. Khilg15.8]
MTKCIFITGTDTDSGKTMAASLILRALSASGHKTLAFKPVATGCAPYNSDALILQRDSSLEQDYDEVNPYAFEPAIAPHIAAAEVDREITLDRLSEHFQILKGRKADLILTEGAGGWQLPLSERLQMPEFVAKESMSVVLVVGMKLGCINHAQLSCLAMEAQGVRVIGWLANQLTAEPMPYYQQNLAYLRRHLKVPHLGEIPFYAAPETATLPQTTEQAVLTAIANSPDQL